jgi:hypothetical protein
LRARFERLSAFFDALNARFAMVTGDCAPTAGSEEAISATTTIAITT